MLSKKIILGAIVVGLVALLVVGCGAPPEGGNMEQDGVIEQQEEVDPFEEQPSEQQPSEQDSFQD
jgi:uncharacterized protein YcfL